MRATKIIAAVATILALAFVAFPALARGDTKRIHEQMLAPGVQVEAPKGVGSGTVIFSKERSGRIETYVVTNYHVIAGAITHAEQYDPEKQANVKRQTLAPVNVRFHRYVDTRHTGLDSRSATIVSYDVTADLALLRLDDDSQTYPVAHVAPAGAVLNRAEDVFAVGGGLGQAPFMTKGQLASTNHVQDGHPYLLATAPIIFGNSGGALYHQNDAGDYEMIGIPSRVSVTGGGFSQSAVTHIGWHIQMTTVRAFLKHAKHEFIVE